LVGAETVIGSKLLLNFSNENMRVDWEILSCKSKNLLSGLIELQSCLEKPC